MILSPVADPILPNTTVKPVLLENGRPPHPPPPLNNQVSDYITRSNKLEEEDNPFEASFGGGPPKPSQAKTPGGTLLLPSIHALQSGAAPSFGSMDGLRSGPLSPSMLNAPKEPAQDYFSADHGGFEGSSRGYTPMESSVRHTRPSNLGAPSSVMSPGAYSLNGANSLLGMQSPSLFGTSVTTPGMAEFTRTASDIAARTHQRTITSQPQQIDENINNDITEYPEDTQVNAAHSLHMLANTASASSRDSSPHYNLALGQSRQVQPSTQKQLLMSRSQQNVQQQMNPVQVNGHMAGRSNNLSSMNGHAVDLSNRNEFTNSTSSSPTSNGNTMGYDNEMNGHGTEAMGKKRAATKRKASTNKTPPKKRSKGGNARNDDMKQEDFTNDDIDNLDDQDGFEENEENHNNGKPKKPETDDEKRKSFLERNRSESSTLQMISC